jgi:ABC-type branched-subunit amino acid transport system substrate-binding protein
MNVVLFIDLLERRLTIEYQKNQNTTRLESFDNNFFNNLDQILVTHQNYRQAYITRLPTGDLGNPYGYSAYASPVTGELDPPSSAVLSNWVPAIQEEIRNLNWGEISNSLSNTLDEWQVPPDVPIRLVVNTNDKNLLLLPFEELNTISRRIKSILLAYMTEIQRERSNASISNPIFRKRALLVMGCVDRVDEPLEKHEIINYLKDGLIVETLYPIDNDNFIRSIRSGDYNTIILIGHSRSLSTGQPSGFQLDSNTWISLEDFRDTFEDAVKKGLEIVLCIGCESIDLAEVLHDIKVPNVIGFRYPVYPRVVRRFFENLKYYWIFENNSLEIAFQKSRKNLRDFDRDFPGTSISPIFLSLPFYTPVKFSQFINWKVKVLSNLNRQLSRLSGWLNVHPRKAKLIKILCFICVALIVMFAIRLTTPEPKLVKTDICSQLGSQKDSYISCGNISFLNSRNVAKDKQDGNNYFQGKKYALAQTEFSRDWRENHDPESLIYMLNAELENDNKASHHVLVAAVIIPAVPLTQEIAKSMLMGVAYAQDRFNSNPNSKWKLKIVIINDRNDSKQNGQAIKVAKELKQLSDRSSTPILGAIGPYSTQLAKAVKDIYAQNRIPIISGTANGKSIASDYFFQTIQNNQNDTKKIIKLLKQRKYSANQIAVFFTPNKNNSSEQSYSQSMVKQIQNDFKISPDKIIDLEKQETLFQGSIDNLRDKMGVKVFVLILDEFDGFTEWKIQNKLKDFFDIYSKKIDSQPKLIANSAIYNSYVFKHIKNHALSINEITFILPVYPLQNRQKNDIYHTFYQLTYNQKLTVDWRIIPTADAAKILTQAIDAAVKEHPDYKITGVDVREQLAKKDANFQIIGGTLKFEDNEPSTKNKMVAAIKYKCSKGQCKPQK